MHLRRLYNGPFIAYTLVICSFAKNSEGSIRAEQASTGASTAIKEVLASIPLTSERDFGRAQ